MKLLLDPIGFGAGMNLSPVSCATLCTSPGVTPVAPSARVTLPLFGNCPTVTLSEVAGLSESLGAAIPIGVGALPEARVSATGTVTGADWSMVFESPPTAR